MIEPQLKIELDGVPSKDPIATLNRLISERSNQLRQAVFKATSAVAVNALKSIRSATRDARKRKKFKIKVEPTSYCVGFSFSDKRPCLRASNDRNSPKIQLNARVVFLTKGIKKPEKDCRVFKVTYEK